jgi:benzodiazapine receptor
MDWLKFFIPVILGFVISIFFPMHSAGSVVKSRPPPIVFGIIWTILYLLIGYCWSLNHKANKDHDYVDFLFIVLNALLVLWVIVYSIDYKLALWLIVLIILFVSYMIWYYTVKHRSQGRFLLPLLIWLMFATLLGMFEIEME